jgi:hypothetical protein
LNPEIVAYMVTKGVHAWLYEEFYIVI